MQGTIGEIRLFGGNFAPRSWALCHGQLLAISSNTALFSIIGTTYGGDGRTTFKLPDLRGRVAISSGTGPGLTPRGLGQMEGAETDTITENTMAAHTHFAQTTITSAALSGLSGTANATIELANGGSGAAEGTNAFLGDASGEEIYANPASSGAFCAPDSVEMNDFSGLNVNLSGIAAKTTVDKMSGGGQSHNNMMTYTTLHYIICEFGVYPSRS